MSFPSMKAIFAVMSKHCIITTTTLCLKPVLLGIDGTKWDACWTAATNTPTWLESSHLTRENCLIQNRYNHRNCRGIRVRRIWHFFFLTFLGHGVPWTPCFTVGRFRRVWVILFFDKQMIVIHSYMISMYYTIFAQCQKVSSYLLLSIVGVTTHVQMDDVCIHLLTRLET